MDRRVEYRPPKEKFWTAAGELPRVRYSEKSHDRVSELKNAGLGKREAHLLARRVTIDGPIFTDLEVLKQLSDDEILNINGIGPASLREIREVAPQVDS